MARVAAIGEQVRVEGFGLAGALTYAADDPSAVRTAWATLPDDVDVVILTPAAASALRSTAETSRRTALRVVLPA